MDEIIFQPNPSLYNPNFSFVVHLSDVATKEELFIKLSYGLNFPDYFGFNWDALYDCLRDFHWIQKERIVLVHDKLPILDEKTFKTYLEILYHSIRSWQDTDTHKFEVVFPLRYKNVIETL